MSPNQAAAIEKVRRNLKARMDAKMSAKREAEKWAKLEPDIKRRGAELLLANDRELTEHIASLDLAQREGSARLNPAASDFEPTIKQKRQITLGHGDRERSRMTKKEKAELASTESGKDGEEGRGEECDA
jgi:hypothetical protein